MKRFQDANTITKRISVVSDMVDTCSEEGAAVSGLNSWELCFKGVKIPLSAKLNDVHLSFDMQHMPSSVSRLSVRCKTDMDDTKYITFPSRSSVSWLPMIWNCEPGELRQISPDLKELFEYVLDAKPRQQTFDLVIIISGKNLLKKMDWRPAKMPQLIVEYTHSFETLKKKHVDLKAAAAKFRTYWQHRIYKLEQMQV